MIYYSFYDMFETKFSGHQKSLGGHCPVMAMVLEKAEVCGLSKSSCFVTSLMQNNNFLLLPRSLKQR